MEDDHYLTSDNLFHTPENDYQISAPQYLIGDNVALIVYNYYLP